MSDESTMIEDLGLDEDLSIDIHPAGAEVTLRIIAMDGNYIGQSEKHSIHITFDDPGQPDTIDDIDLYLGKPGSDDSVKMAKKKREAIKTFYNVFGIDYSAGEVDAQACLGLTGDAILGVDEYQGRRKNKISRFV